MQDLSNVDDKIGHMEDEALKRRQKIEEMKNKRKQMEGSSGDHHQQTVTDKIELPKPKFRSYIPSDDALKESVLPKARPENVNEQIVDELETLKSNETLVEDIDLSKLAPKKIDWDLKRNIAKKLEKLEKRTHVAIAELIRERLKSSEIENLDQATEDLESANQNLYDEDED